LDKIIKPVVWSTRSTKDLEKITKFYIKLYGRSKTRKIITELQKSTEILEQSDLDSSKIGAIDESFLHLKNEYRKLIHHHCKITYREGKTKFYIARVFDMRQNPKKNR